MLSNPRPLSLLLLALVYELFGGLGVRIMSVSFVVGRTEVGLNDISCMAFYDKLWTETSMLDP